MSSVDSPYPSEGLEFLTLWCRMVNVSLSSWMVTMRDYPQPWLEVKDMHLWGRLIGAEQEGLKRGLWVVQYSWITKFLLVPRDIILWLVRQFITL